MTGPADLDLPDQAGVAWRAQDRLAAGHAVVLVFYRGDW